MCSLSALCIAAKSDYVREEHAGGHSRSCEKIRRFEGKCSSMTGSKALGLPICGPEVLTFSCPPMETVQSNAEPSKAGSPPAAPSGRPGLRRRMQTTTTTVTTQTRKATGHGADLIWPRYLNGEVNSSPMPAHEAWAMWQGDELRALL